MVTRFQGILKRMLAMAQEPVDLELVLAADGSGSIDDEELRLQREGYARAVRNPRVLELLTGGIHGRSVIAFVEWGSAESQHTIVDWMVIDGPESAAAFEAALIDAPRQALGLQLDQQRHRLFPEPDPDQPL